MVVECSPKEVRRVLADPDATVDVIDVREPAEFAIGHVPGAENIPMQDLPQILPECNWTAETVVTVCPVGELSRQAGRLIEAYERVDERTVVASLDGGYDAWPYDLEQTAPAHETRPPDA